MAESFIVAEDLALKTLCQGMVVADTANATRQVKVWFGYPDIEVRDQSFPFITMTTMEPSLLSLEPTTLTQSQWLMTLFIR